MNIICDKQALIDAVGNVQRAVSDEAKKVSAKTIKNAYGLLTAVLKDYGVDVSGVKLPQRVKHPSQLLSVGDVVTVWVLEVDEKKKRISLTMKKP